MRPRSPPVSARDHGDARARRAASRTAASLRGADLEAEPSRPRTCSRRRPAPPPASGGARRRRSIRVDAARARRGRRTCPAAGACRRTRGQHDVGEPGDAAAPVDEREADARAQAERHEHVAGAGRGGQLTHPHHRLRLIDYRPSRAEQLLDAALIGHEQEGDGAVLALDDEVGVEQQRDVAGAGALGEHGLRRSRRACRWRSAAASARSPCPVICGQRVDVRGADDVADLRQRGARRSPCRPRRRAGRTALPRRRA